MGYGGIKSLQYRHLYNVCLKWSDAELFELINALERDISFSSFELGQLVRTKTSIDVDEFVEALMDVDESELKGRGVVFPEEKPEEPIDILLRSARYCCTERYNSYAAVSQVLQKLYRQEVSDYRAVHKRYPNPSYVPSGQLYRFMMALVGGRPLPNLSDLSSGAILDFLTCLTSIASIAFNPDNGNDDCNSATNPVCTRMREQLTIVTKMVKQKVGVYMALVGAIHASSFVSIRDEITLKSDFGKDPLTPLRLLCQVKHPDTILGYPPMVEYLVDKYATIWDIPHIPGAYFSDETNCELVPPGVLRFVLKRVLAFPLNPFTLTPSMMAHFQTILSDFHSLCSSRTQLSKFFRTWVRINVKEVRYFSTYPLPLEVIPRKRSRESSVEDDQAKRCCTENPSITNELETEKRYTTERTTSGQQSTVPVTNIKMEDPKNVALTSNRYVKWCPGTHFIRVKEKGEVKNVDAIVNARFKVKTEETDFSIELHKNGTK
uniref:Uncharacterized protein n=1 Tax=Trichobilharzia regenti TaxID=157069 RepID=A0AA85J922_TRIRE|nr:unnamed protein product [Trichobilharzia regenti]